eukprot:m.53585 g.53585  ORF g.53585 m.53585 type:complete len:451 (+) comp15452_c0_seq1:225-1577(+)
MNAWVYRSRSFLRLPELYLTKHDGHELVVGSLRHLTARKMSDGEVPRWVLELTDEELSSQFADLAVAEGKSSVPISASTRPLVEKKFVHMLHRAGRTLQVGQTGRIGYRGNASKKRDVSAVGGVSGTKSSSLPGVFSSRGRAEKPGTAPDTWNYLLHYCAETCMQTIWGNEHTVSGQLTDRGSTGIMSTKSVIKAVHEKLRSSLSQGRLPRNRGTQATALDLLADIIVEDSHSSSPLSYHGAIAESHAYNKYYTTASALAKKLRAIQKCGTDDLTFAAEVRAEGHGSSPRLVLAPILPVPAKRKRFHVAMGSDRFLHVTVPSHLARSVATVDAIRSFALADHDWYGRTWELLIPRMRRSSEFELIFFATAGPGIDTVSVDDMREWHFPTLGGCNADQTIAKYMTRFDLGFSDVTRTVTMKRSDIHIVPDLVRSYHSIVSDNAFRLLLFIP